MQRNKTEPALRRVKQFRLHTSSTNKKTSGDSILLMTLSLSSLKCQKPEERKQEREIKKFNDTKVVNRRISLEKPRQSSCRFIPQPKDKQNQVGYLTYARPSTFKHRTTRTVIMHETIKCSQLLCPTKPQTPKKRPKNFLIGNSLYTNIKLKKKVGDFITKRKQQYFDGIIETVFS